MEKNSLFSSASVYILINETKWSMYIKDNGNILDVGGVGGEPRKTEPFDM